jgi:hypothetical protein
VGVHRGCPLLFSFLVSWCLVFFWGGGGGGGGGVGCMYPNSFVILIRVSSRDTGKTMVDASLGEIMTTCEKITWLLSEGERWLKPEYRYLISFFINFM